jgi:hypothetical protein
MTDRYGYGMFKLRRDVRVTSSRFAFVLKNAVEPMQALVCHHCDNPACCNPGHLYLGNAKTNMNDKVQRGRAKGRFSEKVQ